MFLIFTLGFREMLAIESIKFASGSCIRHNFHFCKMSSRRQVETGGGKPIYHSTKQRMLMSVKFQRKKLEFPLFSPFHCVFLAFPSNYPIRCESQPSGKSSIGGKCFIRRCFSETEFFQLRNHFCQG